MITTTKKNQSFAYGRKYRGYYSRKVARDVCSTGKKVDFEFGQDETSYSGPNPRFPKRKIVHIGLSYFGEFPDGTDVWQTEQEWNTHVRYVITHEEGHIFHTTSRAWMMANTNGTKAVISYIAEQVTGRKPRLTDDASYNQMLNELRTKYNVYVNLAMVREMVHFVLNSIEDGRMERRMAAGRPGFLMDMRYCRAKSWQHTPIDPNTDQNDARQYFILVCNQILTLATMGIYQKGYSDYVLGTACDKEVRVLIPEIKAGVTARSCRQGMLHALNIINALCPLFYKACLMNDFEKALSEFISNLANALPDLQNGESESTQYDADEKSSEQNESDDGSGAYQFSDSEDESSGKPVSFNIFSDEDNEEKKDEAESDGQGQSKEESEQDQNGNSNGSNSQENSENKSASNGQTAGEGEQDNSSDQNSNSDSGKDRSGNNDDKNNNSKSDSNESSDKKSDSKNNGQSGSKDQDVIDTGVDNSELVQKAMEEAAEAALGESSFAESAVRSTGSQTEKKQESEDNSSILDFADDVSDICENFREYFRAYELTEDLPIDIEQECRVTRMKYEEYFKSRRKPVRRGMRSGRLDPRRFSSIVLKDMDIFCQPGEDDSFSGCIYVLVDNSGSMDGVKKSSAMEICARLEEIFKGLVPLKVAAFDEWDTTNFEIIKNWNDDFKKNCSWNFLRYGRDGGGTPTKEALLVARRELMARAEKHKMILLITDENAYYANDRLPAAITEVRKSGIQLEAAYVEEQISERDKKSFKDLFGDNSIAVLPDELSDALLPIVRNFTAL